MSGPGRRKTADIEDTFREFWNDRPVRPLRGGKIAGVSAALGNRYGIDPVLVRVAFVVGAFYGGAGIVLYLLGCLVLPRQVSDRPGENATRSTSGPLVVVLVLLLVPAAFAVADFAGVVGLAVGLGALYLLQRHYGDRGRTSPQPVDDAPFAPVSPPSADHGSHTWVYPGPADGTGAGTAEPLSRPPSWDPLGAAPFAWDLPEPGQEPSVATAEPRRPRRSVTVVTLALALIAGGFSVAGGLPPTAALAIPLGVLGLGMIAGAFLRGGRGLIGFAIPVAALALLASVLPVSPWRGVTTVELHPTTLGSVQERYTGSVGRIRLNLDDLAFTDGDRLTTSARLGLGEVSVQLPPDVDATVRCSADRGEVDCLGEQEGGRGVRASTTDYGTDGPGGGNIVLDLHASTGHVEVTRG